jgi:hydrogenase maturation protein HypF
VRSEISYEAQACIELESLAGDSDAAPLPFVIDDRDEEPFVVDLRAAVRALDRRAPARMAAAFHETMAQVVLAGCLRARAMTGIDTVALSGGCFQNARLGARCIELLSGFTVLVHHRVPPNDGGLSLGQAAIAAYRRRECVSASPVK